MITNILATLFVVVTTNTFHQKQYKAEDGWILAGGYKIETVWQNNPPISWNGMEIKVRNNPDIRFTFVVKTTFMRFYHEGIEKTVELSSMVIRRKKQFRVGESWVGGWID